MAHYYIATLAHYYITTLLQFGFQQVDQAVDGLAGWEMIKKNKYDYIVTDIKMPGMNGDELITKTRQFCDQGAKVKIIVITGGSVTNYSSDQRQTLRQQIDSYLKKPFTQQELQVVLTRIS